LLARETVLGITQPGRSDKPCRHHAQAAHHRDGDCAATRKTIRRDCEHGGPEKRFADRINRERPKSASESSNTTDEVQSEARQGSTGHQNPDGTEPDIFLDEISAKTKREHERGGEHKEPGGLRG